MPVKSMHGEHDMDHNDGAPRRHLPSAAFVAALAVVLGVTTTLFVWLGAYDIAADAPHTRPVYWILDQLRDRSVATHARGIAAPADLMAPLRISTGAGLYAEMCSGCHLAPGMEKTELSQGLYPQAPDLAKGDDLTPAEQFWIIKHGVKLSAMPAWGRTHPDPLIWDMVALVRTLPKLSAAQYKAAVGRAPADHDEIMKDVIGKE